MHAVKDEHIREFAARDWARVAESDRAHWVERFRLEGSSATVSAGHALFEHARRARRDFPGARYAETDLKAHVRLKAFLDQAAHAFPFR